MNVYIDMDGTLTEYRPDATLADYMSDGFYESLMPSKLAGYANELATREDLDVYVLSIYILPPAYQEKQAWLDYWCPNIDAAHRLILPAGTDKAAAIEEITGQELGQYDVLIDDHTPNLLSWERSGGRGIKWLNEVNGLGKTFNGERIGDIDTLDAALSGSELLPEKPKKKHRSM